MLHSYWYNPDILVTIKYINTIIMDKCIQRLYCIVTFIRRVIFFNTQICILSTK